MKFNASGHARAKGIQFTVKYGEFLDGDPQSDHFYVQCENTPTGGHADKDYIFVDTEATHRFPTREKAEQFCEDIAAGKYDLTALKAEMNAARELAAVQRKEAAEKEFQAFAEKAGQLNIDIADLSRLLPEIFSLSWEARKLLSDEKYCASFASRQPQPSKEPVPMTLQQFVDVYQKNIDIRVMDKDTGVHFLPALYYLTEEELASGVYEYEPYEEWLLTLPVSHTIDQDGCLLAVLRTDFSWDQTCFLLDDGAGFDSTDWADLSIRSVWADADFNQRLAFLKDGTPFEKLFDGNLMDAADPSQRAELCQLLSKHAKVCVAPSIHNEAEFYAYEVSNTRFGRVQSETEIDIKFTEPGEGLASTLEGKIAWSEHLAKRRQNAAEPEAKTSPNKGQQEVR